MRSKAVPHKCVLTDSYFAVLRFEGFLLALVCVTRVPEWYVTVVLILAGVNYNDLSY